jgi:tetratricopeptide (TPR) repeat protein
LTIRSVHLVGCLGFLLTAASPAPQRSALPPAPPDVKAVSAMIERGVALARQGRVEEAEREFKQALAANPARLDARQHLARLYLDEKKEAEAVAELRRAAPLGPLDRDLAMKLASAEESEGRVAQATRQLRSVADRFQSVQALLQLARLQNGQKNAAGALQSLVKARGIAPNSEEVLRAYAETALAAKAPLTAVPALESLTRICPTVAQYHYMEGLALIQAGDVAASVDSLREAERLEPNRPPTLIALGTALNSRKLYNEAKPFLLRALNLEPENGEAAASLAEAEQGLGELESAEVHARRALARAPGNPTASLALGMVLMKRERYGEARDALQKSLAADPSSATAHYQLSLAYARLGDEGSSAMHLEMYRREAKQAEERIKAVRDVTGFSMGGMQP